MWSLPPSDSVLHFLSLVALAAQAMTAALASWGLTFTLSPAKSEERGV
jgi:hypothetical protein